MYVLHQTHSESVHTRLQIGIEKQMPFTIGTMIFDGMIFIIDSVQNGDFVTNQMGQKEAK